MYNEAEVVDALRADLERFMREVKSETEIILVNDGSTDETLAQNRGWARATVVLK